jgi:hypothetical protein
VRDSADGTGRNCWISPGATPFQCKQFDMESGQTICKDETIGWTLCCGTNSPGNMGGAFWVLASACGTFPGATIEGAPESAFTSCDPFFLRFGAYRPFGSCTPCSSDTFSAIITE